MKISKKDVDYVATLARLEFETKEEEKLTGQLESILGYVDKIKEVDTSKIEPTSHGFTGENVWREDIVVKSDSKTIDSMFKNDPAKYGTFFKVEKVIDSED